MSRKINAEKIRIFRTIRKPKQHEVRTNSKKSSLTKLMARKTELVSMENTNYLKKVFHSKFSISSNIYDESFCAKSSMLDV